MPEMFRPPQGPCFADLRGKVALVTGGGAGIGRGISIRLAQEGMHVFLCGRRPELLQEMAERIRQAGGQATPIAADLSREEDVAGLFAKIRETCPAIDVLVHNAALVARGSFEKTDAAYWHRMMAANVDSSFYLAKECAAMMIPRRSGSIVFISTIGAVRAHDQMVAYDTSKGAVDSFTQALALELGRHGIRVNAIAPGPIIGQDMTGRGDSAWKQRSEKALDAEIPSADVKHEHIPVRRYGTPADIGAAAAFLASEQASYISGHVLAVDGGALAQLSPPGIWI